MALLATGGGSTTSDVSQYETYGEAIKLVRGDTLPEIQMTLRDQNTAADGQTLDPNDASTWAPLDLTGVTAVLKFRPTGSSVIKETLPMYAVGDPANGRVFMQWGSDTLDTAGEFTGEIELTYSNGHINTVFEQMSFIVREDY